MASIIWSGDLLSTSCSLHWAGEREKKKKKLNLKHSSPSGRSVTHKKLYIFAGWTWLDKVTFANLSWDGPLLQFAWKCCNNNPPGLYLSSLLINYYSFDPFVLSCWRRDRNVKNTNCGENVSTTLMESNWAL